MRDRTEVVHCTTMTGDEIREARKHLGLTQSQLAEVMGMTDKSYISKLESGGVNLGRTSQKLLQAYLDGYRPKDWPVKS